MILGCYNILQSILRGWVVIIHYSYDFTSEFLQEYREYARERGVNPVVHLVLATVPVHETSLANQHFYIVGEGVCTEYSLYSCENYGWALYLLRSLINNA